MRIVVLLGAPGAGKGTQAPLLADRLGIPVVATGDLFRAAVRDRTPLGAEAKRYMDAGELVPDQVTIGLLLDRLGQPDAAGGAILDGFPRTRVQAQALDGVLAERESSVAVAVLVHVPAEELVRRLSGRWICRAAGHPYHEVSSPPREPGRCDVDGPDRVRLIVGTLVQLRAIDEVIAHYREAGLLRTVDGLQPIDTVSEAVAAAVDAAGLS